MPPERIQDQSQLSAAAGTVQVTFKRDAGMNTGGCPTRVFIDGAPVADIWTAEKLVLHLQPGDHILSVEPTSICGGSMQQLRISLAVGKPQRFRIGYDFNGSLIFQPTAF